MATACLHTIDTCIQSNDYSCNYRCLTSVKIRNKTAHVIKAVKVQQTAQPGLWEHGETNCCSAQSLAWKIKQNAAMMQTDCHATNKQVACNLLPGLP